MDGIIENEHEYLRSEEYLKSHPRERLAQFYRKKDAAQAVEAEKRQIALEDTKEIVEEVERWNKEEESLKAAKVNTVHITGRKMAHKRTMKDLEEKFDRGLLTPLHPVEKKKTELDEAKENLKKTEEKLKEAEQAIEKFKGQ